MRRLDAPATVSAETSTPALQVPRLPGSVRIDRLDNGLTVCRVENRRAPVVTSALFYRAGARDEGPCQGGTAHFLEHMMFKGSTHYGAGEIDRRTQALGGSNNAFTSHDITAYYFDFAPDRWTEALAIEADRMAGLTLDPDEVESERRVILEEIAMYEGEPWDALELAVHRELFGEHAYGRPVLGTREELAGTGQGELAAFHRRFYQPGNGVLVVAGDVGEEALAEVEATFGALPGAAPLPTRTVSTPPPSGRGLRRLERRHGEVPRLLLALPAPAAPHPDHPALRLLLVVLGSGRASRLTRRLVEEGQLCSWISADLGETSEPGSASIATELVGGVEPERVEAEIFAELAELARHPPSEKELARARQIVLADWVFGHERVHHQALTVGGAVTLFDLEHPERQLSRLLAVEAERLPEIARRYLDPEKDAVLGWSLPNGSGEGEEGG